MRYHWIYDTPALVGHANGTSSRVRAGLRCALESIDFQLTIPAACLLEAYEQVAPDSYPLLDWLATSPGVRVAPVGDSPTEFAAIGQVVGETGRAGAAHAAHLALIGDGPCIVFTDTAMPSGVLSRPV